MKHRYAFICFYLTNLVWMIRTPAQLKMKIDFLVATLASTLLADGKTSNCQSAATRHWEPRPLHLHSGGLELPAGQRERGFRTRPAADEGGGGRCQVGQLNTPESRFLLHLQLFVKSDVFSNELYSNCSNYFAINDSTFQRAATLFHSFK